MKFSRILILAVAAWAGTWFYKLSYTPPAEPGQQSADGQPRNLYSAVTGHGSLGATLKASKDARDAHEADLESVPKPVQPTNSKSFLIPSPQANKKRAGAGVGSSPAVEDLAPDDNDLIQAAAKGDKSVVERRVGMHVKIDSRDAYRRTPLMYASWNGNDDVASRLLAAGANPELRDREGNNAFDYAASRGLTDTLHFMLERTHTTDDHHYMEYATIMQATYAGDPARLPQGTGKLASVNHINPQGQAPLHIAAGNGSYALMQALIRRGADVNLTNDSRQTPLQWAAWNNQTQAMDLLIGQGAQITLADSAGNSPLILAAENGSVQAVDMLLAKGADRYAANKEGKTPAIMAEDKGFTELAAKLK